MTTQELRIGNWVYNSYTKQNMKVYPMMIPQLHRIEKENGSLKDCNIEPITLSEEVLLKCGCNISPLVTGLRYKHLYKLVWDDEFKYWDILQGEYGYFITRIQYIHEWQNFIHILNGEELEVSL